jgi:uncharacterized OB-fold protein
MCPSCQSVDREAIEATGQGKVHSWIVSSHPSQPGGPSDIVGLIDLDEGLRLVANLTGLEGRTVTNDMPVEVVFVDGADYVFPQFRPMIEAPE